MGNRNLLFRVLLDFIMIALLATLYNKNMISLMYHEVLGLAIVALFFLHLWFNRKWIAGMIRGMGARAKTPRVRLVIAVDVLLALVWGTVIVTGVLVSKKLFSFGLVRLNPWHFFCAALSLIVTGVHFGLHWDLFWGWIGKGIRLPRAIGIVLTIAVFCFGGYRVVTSSFSRWLTAPWSTAGHHHHETVQTAAPHAANAPAIAEDSSHTHGGGHGRGRGMGRGRQPLTLSRFADVCATNVSIMFFFAVLARGADVRFKKRRLRALAASSRTP